MKKILSYISVLCVALMSTSCESDLEKEIYDANSALPAVISDIASSYVLEADLSGDLALTVEWSEPDFGFNAAATNNLEMDVAGNSFEGKEVLTSINDGGKYEVTHKELNSTILKLLEKYELPMDEVSLELRVVSSFSDAVTALISNIVTTKITPFSGEKEYPLIAVRGDYCGWDFNSAQKIYSENSDDVYSGMIYFDGKAANGWKLCEDEGWSVSWSVAEEAAAPTEPESLTLDGGSNIKDFGKMFYKFEFDKTTLELTVSASYDTWGVVGDCTGWGGSPDAEMSLSSEVDETGATQHFLTATVDLVAGQGWKVRADNTWGKDFGSGTFEEEPAGADGNYSIPEDGNYTIKWYFNKVEQKLTMTKN
ncbi:MAG: SusE domain-containing protein [Rikenellaceae bacterium]